MRYLSRDWARIKATLKNKDVVLLLDFDGTLAPLEKRPTAVTLSPATRKVLMALHRSQRVRVAIVSGRRLEDVRKLLKIPRLIIAGNHGLEVKGSGLSFIHPEAKTSRALLAKTAKKLRQSLHDFSGILIEEKKYSLSVHYRLLPFFRVSQARAAFLEAVGSLAEDGLVRLTEGKKVWEVRPPVSWNKGNVSQWLLSELKKKSKKKPFVFYFGDDTTDEDAFAALARVAVTVRVGAPFGQASKAHYFVRNVEAVHAFLEELYAEIKK